MFRGERIRAGWNQFTGKSGQRVGRKAIVEAMERRIFLAGDFASALRRGSTGADAALATAFDESGNAIIAGSFSGTVDFAPTGTDTFLNATAGNGYVAKYNSTNDMIWARQVGGPVQDVIVDRTGFVYAVGVFSGTKDFDNTAATLNLTSAGFNDIFIVKYNSAGVLQWARRVGGSFTDNGSGIGVDQSGNVYITGYFGGTVDFDPSTGVVNRTATITDGFVLKLSNGGSYQRVSILAGNGTERTNDIAVDSIGNVYAVGDFDKTADFDPNAGVVSQTSDASLGGNYDGFIWGINTDGTYRFVKRFGGGLYDVGEGIDIDVVGNVYITGRFTYQANFNVGGSGGTVTAYGSSGGDAFVAKYNSMGVFAWVRKMGGTDTANEWGRGVYVDGGRNVYVTGQFAGTANLNPLGTANVTSAGGTDVFVAKFNQHGTFSYGKRVGGTGAEVGRGIAVDALRGNLFVVGEFSGTADFDPGSGTQNRVSDGGTDIFLLKLTQVASPLLWAQKKPNEVSQDEGRFVGTDSSGNTYIAGLLRGAGDFDPTGKNLSFGPIGAAADVFVAKFAYDGTFQWMRIAYHRETDYTLGEETIGGMAVDAFGNVVVVGTFLTTEGRVLDFPNTTSDLTSDSHSKDAFIWKLNSSGGHVFARKFSSDSTETANGVAMSIAGEIYVTGTFDYRVQWGPDDEDEIEAGDVWDGHSQDVWVAKYSSTGFVQWATASGGDEVDTPTDIVFDYVNNVVRVVGTFNSPTFEADRSYFSPSVTKAGAVSSFITRYSPTTGVGNQVKRLGGGVGETRVASIDVDSLGAYYVTGSFTGTSDFDPNAGTQNKTALGAADKTDVFLVKLSAAGDHVFSHRIGNTENDTARAIDVLDDNVVVVGDFRTSVDFEPIATKAKTLTAAGLVNGFIWRLNRAGEFRSVHSITGAPWDVVLSTGGFARIIGNTSASGDFDPGASTSFPFESPGSQDWFLLKFKLTDTPSTPVVAG